MSGAAWLGVGLAAGCGLSWAVFSWRERRRERLRAKLLSFVAHELNTPVLSLNLTVMNFLEGLFGPVSEEHKPWMVLIREQVARLAALVGDLRDLVHIEFHHDFHVNREPLDLASVVRSSLDTMRDAMKRAGAEVELRLPESLPRVHGDPDRLLRVVTAMLTHARKFRAKGAIAVSADGDGGDVRLLIEYAGVPGAAADAGKALDLYFPARHGESQVLATTGLGLGLPRRVVDAHGGEMTLDADDEGRCRVRIRLPGVPDEEDTDH